MPLREAEAAGEPGDWPASDSAPPDLCPGARAILGCAVLRAGSRDLSTCSCSAEDVPVPGLQPRTRYVVQDRGAVVHLDRFPPSSRRLRPFHIILLS